MRDVHKMLVRLCHVYSTIKPGKLLPEFILSKQLKPLQVHKIITVIFIKSIKSIYSTVQFKYQGSPYFGQNIGI